MAVQPLAVRSAGVTAAGSATTAHATRWQYNSSQANSNAATGPIARLAPSLTCDVVVLVYGLVQLVLVCGVVVVLLVIEVADSHHQLLMPISINVGNGGRAQDVRVKVDELSIAAVVRLQAANVQLGCA